MAILTAFYSVAAGSDGVAIPNQLISLIERQYGDFSIAKSADFHDNFENFCKRFGKDLNEIINPIVISDLNDDGIADYAIAIINKQKRNFKFICYVSTGNSYKDFILSSADWPDGYDGKIWQVMWLKKKGDYGISKQKYFNAPGKEYPYGDLYTDKDVLEYEKAIENYKNIEVIEKTDVPYGFFDTYNLFYCISSYFFANDTIKSVSKCD